MNCKWCDKDTEIFYYPTDTGCQSVNRNDKKYCFHCGILLQTLRMLKEEQIKEMPLRSWLWIKQLKTGEGAYYQKTLSYNSDKSLSCGYPGIGFEFDYKDYGIIWQAFIYVKSS